METTLTKQSSPQKLARERFKHEFYVNGVQPVDGRQPISDELAIEMIQELNVPKDALIGVVDAFLILSTHLKEAGYTNLVLLESSHQNLTSSQEKYYNNVKTLCGKSNIKYYIPPMNNYGRCDMKFDVVIGNPPYQSGDKMGRGGSKKLWKEFLEIAISNSDYVSFIVPPTVFAPSTFSNINKRVSFISFNIGHHFPGVGSDFCRLIVHSEEVETTKVETRSGSFVEFPAGSKPSLPSQYGDRFIELDGKFFGQGRKWKLGIDRRRPDVSKDGGKYEIVHSQNEQLWTNKEYPELGIPRVHLQFTGKTNFKVVTDKLVSGIHLFTTFNTIEEAEEYAERLNQPDVIEYLNLSKFSGMTYKQTLESLEI